MEKVKRVKLGEVALINPPFIGPESPDMEVSFVPMAGVSESSASVVASELRKLAACRKGYTPFQRNDVLVAKITPCFENGKIVQADIPTDYGFGSTEFHVLRPKNGELHPRYLLHFLRQPSVRQAGIRNMTGSAGQRRVPASFLSTFDIPLPPFASQARIASILDKADALRRKRQEALRLTDDFLRSVFLDMFGDIRGKRTKHPISTIRPFVRAQSGKSSASVVSREATGIPIYGGNGVNGWATRALFHEPVVVAGRVGQQCGIIHFTEGPAWVTDNAIILQVNDKGKLDAIYLGYAFQQSSIRDTVTHLDLPFINQSMLLDQPLPLPPLDEQVRFRRLREKALGELTSVLRHTSDECSRLLASVTQAAFSGEIG